MLSIRSPVLRLMIMNSLRRSWVTAFLASDFTRCREAPTATQHAKPKAVGRHPVTQLEQDHAIIVRTPTISLRQFTDHSFDYAMEPL